ncbi:protein SLC31A2 [Denticeps clupeoides]|uniref:Copper transport protein n=1 Tax=Denticeps clupeoides TaxID=299321 RepID=A0AAY4E4S8_9TELE|nr:probable low affinity copper uptake protein 2 [Denticeps clupeoides]XP_028828692.1 probable low affinity copper uptake protein 2 [Denticeps clupeoides]
MFFEGSSSVTLLFKFWDVRGPAGMVLSVFVVLLLTVLYELMKVWKVQLSKRAQLSLSRKIPRVFSPTAGCHDNISVLANVPSETSLATTDSTTASISATNSWLVHGLQTVVHIAQVTLGYLLMLCVMSYNVWIFLGVIIGSVIGYFLAYPLLGKV